MITLHHFSPFYGLPDPSPFCLKVHLYMRAAGIEFQSKLGAQNLRIAPKGKLPFIDDDGKVVADSNFIIPYLNDKYGDKLDADLNPAQKATAHAFGRMLDENLYWCIVHSRWIGEDLWPTVKKDFFGKMPLPLRAIFPAMARREVRKSLWLHGLGRHSAKEILEVARRDLSALSDMLGNNDYFLINRPSTLDVTAFAFLAELIVPPYSSEMNKLARSFGNLVRFVERVKKQYYPD